MLGKSLPTSQENELYCFDILISQNGHIYSEIGMFMSIHLPCKTISRVHSQKKVLLFSLFDCQLPESTFAYHTSEGKCAGEK